MIMRDKTGRSKRARDEGRYKKYREDDRRTVIDRLSKREGGMEGDRDKERKKERHENMRGR